MHRVTGALRILASPLRWARRFLYGRALDRAVQGEVKPHEYVAARNDTWRTVATVIGGMGLFGSLFFTWRTFNLANQSYDLAFEGQLTDRFTRAVELLGETNVGGGLNLEARLGAIFALERIARDSERDHWSVMEVLSAYIREHAQREYAEDDSAVTEIRSRALREDVQTALTVIGRRDVSRDPTGQWLDLADANLTGADLVNANLAGANLRGTTLAGANLWDANLTGADLGWANLTDAGLQSAELAGAILQSANLTRADLWGVSLTDASLSYADLTGANLGVTSIDPEQLFRTVFDDTTIVNPLLRTEVRRLRAEATATAAAP